MIKKRTTNQALLYKCQISRLDVRTKGTPRALILISSPYDVLEANEHCAKRDSER